MHLLVMPTYESARLYAVEHRLERRDWKFITEPFDVDGMAPPFTVVTRTWDGAHLTDRQLDALHHIVAIEARYQ